MKAEFWIDSWEREGTCTSFHRPDIHPYVVEHATPEFLGGKRVLVPLCGKTNDMLWFARYAAQMTGVELVEKPILQFFEQNSLSYQHTGPGRFESGNMTLLQRDVFTLTTEEIGRVDLVYDRAALVALPPDMRVNYVAKMHELIPIGGQIMLNTLEYAPVLPEPPFTIAPDEVLSYYGERFLVNHLAGPECPEHRMIPKFGLNFLKEHFFLLTRVS